MNAFDALWRFLAFRWVVAVSAGAMTAAVLGLLGAPLVIAFPLALAPPAWVAGWERLTLQPFWRRWFRTGRGAAGDWMSPVELKKHTRPVPRRLG